MHLEALVEYEKRRIARRKQNAYTRGRSEGYSFGLELAAIPNFPSSEDFVTARVSLRKWLRSDQAVRLEGDYGSGFRRSVKNIYHAMYDMVYEPNLTRYPVSDAQFRAIAVISGKTGEEFYGLTSGDAACYIKTYGGDHGSGGQC